MHGTTQPTSATDDTGKPLAYDVNGAARELSVSVRQIRRLIAEGELRSIMIRGSRRITREELERYVTALTAPEVDT